MATTSPGARLTYQDFLLFPDDGLRHELIDGVHYVTPSPNQRLVRGPRAPLPMRPFRVGARRRPRR